MTQFLSAVQNSRINNRILLYWPDDVAFNALTACEMGMIMTGVIRPSYINDDAAKTTYFHSL